MWAAIIGQGAGEASVDGVCVLSIKQQRSEGSRTAEKLSNVRRLIQALTAQRCGSSTEVPEVDVTSAKEQRQQVLTLGAFCSQPPSNSKSGSHASAWLRKHGWRALQLSAQASAASSAQKTALQHAAVPTTIMDIPAAAVYHIYQALDSSTRRAVLLSSKQMRQLFSRAVRTLHLSASDIRHNGAQQLSRLPLQFPDLNELHLKLGNETELLLQLRQLKRSSSSLSHLHTFALDSRLRDDVFQVAARLLVMHPNLTRLQLPHQRCGTAADQRVLATVLEALPCLTHLDLGYTPSSSGGSTGGTPKASAAASNAITPSVFRRILRLKGLRQLSCNASAVADSQLAALSSLRNLQELRISAAGSGQGLAMGLAGLSRLTSLELHHPGVAGELAGSLRAMKGLRVLALGLCPKLTDAIMQEVADLQQLEKLTVPFTLSAPHLRILSRLPVLQELFTWRNLELDVLGPAHEPLHRITHLVASSIHGRGKSLATWFPALEAVCLKHCSNMAALSLRGCVGLQELMAGECGQLSDDGFVCLRELRALQRLQLDGAVQVTDAAFSAVFSKTMPALHSISMIGFPSMSDAGLQSLTASCRRLSTITIGSCRQLTDKTLKRLAHCEHLNRVVLKGCRGFTAEGVAALAAAPQMKTVTVLGCPGVRKSLLCKGHPPGVTVRVDDRL